MNPNNPYADLLESQKAYFRSGATFSTAFRKQQLELLKGILLDRQKEIEQALQADLGKSSAESWFSEIGLTLSAIDWNLRHLDSLSRAKYHLSPIHQFPSIAKTVRIPYGSVLILSPWNYPFLLAMVPFVEAIAAGNTAIIKTGHAAKHTSAAIADLIHTIYPREFAEVIEGGHEQISALLELDFDYIFFTGGKKLGSIVMESAAKHLTPVTLELGGKSPAVVDESANLALAARRIVFGKLLNAGQTCVAPDYCVVHESVAGPFLALLEKEIRCQYPNPASIGKIIDEKHFQRLVDFIRPASVFCGGRASESTLQIEPTVLYPAGWDDPIMQEEIFGPILPVLVYRDFRDLMKKIACLPTPLAFYLFSRSRMQKDWMQYVQPFGGGCINDTIVQLTVEDLPFGGMGASGMGQYHGKYGYETFTHIKSVLIRGTWPDLPMRYNNRQPWMEKAIRRVMR